LGKAYKRYPSRWGRLAEWLRPQAPPRHELLWILRGLNLRVPQGQALGIIGRNGAGKSTLLKMVTGTTTPTEGSVQMQGRVAALLELGMGFHGDFTGRQNAWISAQLLGLTDHEIATAMPSIEAFAEIGHYMDEPVRTYSSGMQVRLAFSVATALRPDVLIVDEALAVGDVYFQHKCYARIREFRAQGTTLVFVSHDPGAIKSLCDRAVLLDAGRIVADDAPDQVLDLYNALVAERENTTFDATAAPVGERSVGVRSGDGRARLLAVAARNAQGPAQVFRVGEALELRVRLCKQATVDDLTVGFLLRDRLGNDVFGTNSWHVTTTELAQALAQLAPGVEATLCWRIPALNIGPGSYTISVALHGDMTHVENRYDGWDIAARVEVVRGPEPLFEGVCYLRGVAAVLEVDEGLSSGSRL
ncbi:MAG: ABC transporter ATP-binding protein, partial [Burkholderiaceae bacterium]|nr:ABC transporter ATP-binding protein [Burkholderiaceae bacterium]